MPLPPLPKALRSLGAPTAAETQRRVDEWARGQQALVAALRDGNPSILSRLDELEAAPSGGGGVSAHADLTGLSADDHTQYLLANGTRALSGALSAGSNKITNLAAPTNANDAARLTDIPVLPDSYDDYNVNAPPASPHADDDECNGSSVAGAWSTFDPYSGTVPMTVTATPTRGYYQFTRAVTNPTNAWGGLYKAIPSGSEWAIIGKFSFDFINTSPTGFQTGIGLALYEDPSGAPTTSNIDLLIYGPTGSVRGGVSRGLATAYNNFPAMTTNNADGCYLRIRKGPSQSGYDFSPDGYTWSQLTNGVSGYGYWGPVTYGWAQLRARCHWLRVLEASGVSTFSTCPPIPGAMQRKYYAP